MVMQYLWLLLFIFVRVWVNYLWKACWFFRILYFLWAGRDAREHRRHPLCCVV